MKNKGYEFSYNICSKANQEKLLVDVDGIFDTNESNYQQEAISYIKNAKFSVNIHFGILIKNGFIQKMAEQMLI